MTSNLSAQVVLQEGTRLELPLWMALALARRRMVNVSLPSYLSERFKVSLLADPVAVNLADRSLSFYEVGLAMATQFGRPDLRTMLQQSLAVRFQHILQHAQVHANRSKQQLIEDTFQQKLTYNEKASQFVSATLVLPVRTWEGGSFRCKNSKPAGLPEMERQRSNPSARFFYFGSNKETKNAMKQHTCCASIGLATLHHAVFSAAVMLSRPPARQSITIEESSECLM